MRCGRCRTEVMLGSAQCAKCGASILDGSMPDGPAALPSMVGQRTPPPPPAAPAGVDRLEAAILGVGVPTTPPAPPPGSAAPPRSPAHRPPILAPRGRRSAPAGQAAKASLGCFGCLGPIIAVVVVVAVLASVSTSVFDGIGDALGGGERVDGPAVVLGEPVEFELGSDDTGVHPFDAPNSGRVIVSVEGVADFDPTVSVVEDDAVLGTDDDSGDGRASLLSVDVAEGGRYDMEVEEFGGDSGEYVLLVTSPDVEGAPVARASEADGAVGPGETATHRLVSAAGEVTVRVLGRNGFDPVLTIVDAAGAVLGTNDDADGHDSRLTITLAVDTAAIIQVDGFGGTGGLYTVVVE